jgi:hypothetical protein
VGVEGAFGEIPDSVTPGCPVEIPPVPLVEVFDLVGAGEVSGLPWLGQLTAIDSQPALDDRFAAAATLEGENRVARIAVRLRAVTAGSFELPGAEVREMYRPAIFARQATARIAILP